MFNLYKAFLVFIDILIFKFLILVVFTSILNIIYPVISQSWCLLTRFTSYNRMSDFLQGFCAESFYYRINMNSHFLEWFSTKYHNKNLQLLLDHCIWHKGYLTFSSSTTLIIVPNWTNVVWIYLCMCAWFC